MAVEDCSTPPIEIIRNDRRTDYIGSREQLIGAGFAHETQFPEGRKRVKCEFAPISQGKQTDSWRIEKLKGGRFLLRKWHEHQPPQLEKFDMYSSPAKFRDGVIQTANLKLGVLMRDARGEFEFGMWGETTLCFDEQSAQAIALAGARLIDAIKAARVISPQKKPNPLTIVKSS